MPRLLALIAVRSASLLTFFGALGIRRIPLTTLERYLTLPESIFLVELLPACSRNESKRFVKSPEIFLNDHRVCPPPKRPVSSGSLTNLEVADAQEGGLFTIIVMKAKGMHVTDMADTLRVRPRTVRMALARGGHPVKETEPWRVSTPGTKAKPTARRAYGFRTSQAGNRPISRTW